MRTLPPHVQPGDRSCRAGSPFDEVTNHVDQPQAMTAPGVRWQPSPPGQRVSDVAGVLDLAQQLVAGVPRPHDAGASSVAERVGGELTDCEYDVVDAGGLQAGRSRPR